MNQKLMMSNWFPGFSHQWRLFESKSVHLFSWQLLHRYSNTNTRFFQTKRLPNINVYSIIIRITTTCFVFYFRVFGTERGFWELEALKVECTREGGGKGVWGCLIHCLQQTNTEIPIWVHFHKILPFYKYLSQIVA